MKTVYLLVIMLTASILFNACSNDNVVVENNKNEFCKMQFFLGGSIMDDRGTTRGITVAEPVYKFVAGDKFGVYCETTRSEAGSLQKALNAPLTFDNADGQFSDFDYYWPLNRKSDIFLYYPYSDLSDENATYSQGSILASQVQDDIENGSATKCNNLLYRFYAGFETIRNGKFFVENLKPYFPVITFSVVCNDPKYAGWTVKNAKLVSTKPLNTGSYYVGLEDMSLDWEDPSATAGTFTVTNAPGTTWTLSTDKAVNVFMTLPVTTVPTTLTMSVDITNGTETKTFTLIEEPTLTLQQGKTYAYYFTVGTIGTPSGGSTHEGFTPNN